MKCCAYDRDGHPCSRNAWIKKWRLCPVHYNQFHTSLAAQAGRCIVDGCPHQIYVLKMSLCRSHYYRFCTYGVVTLWQPESLPLATAMSRLQQGL